MNRLKRQRSNLDRDDHKQKRACSDSSPSNLDQYERAAQYHRVTTSPSMQAQSVVPKRCIHKIVTACNLTQATCCACLDARPDGFETARGMDEEAWGSAENRWQYYCLDCQEYWGLHDDADYRHRRLRVLTAREVPDVIRVSYGVGDIDITRSLDLTLDGLKGEVAQLMRCDPRQLMVSDIAMCGGRAVPEMSSDNALVLCATHIEFRCVTNVESEDDEMEDV
ncbi:hypothetical protein OPT61_g4481 [Boeremia exigua]|uniref:Uncharacterized protein n=1 Tax=Boeremia exigua TaxID=749465 RepID=A0ACC2IE18_9PLEO|nr:hypothetical protein OPT61_g4481 [Boeremia exigua]